MSEAANEEAKAIDEGYALVEVLVAFAIVTMGLVSFYSALSSYAVGTAREIFRAETMAYAQSQLAVLAVPGPLSNEPDTGRYPNGAVWRVTLSPAQINNQNVVYPRKAFFVRLEVFDQQQRLILTLDGLKMVPTRMPSGPQ